MGWFSSDTDEKVTEKSVITNNLISENQIKTTNDELENLMFWVLILLGLIIVFFVIKFIYKASRNITVRDQILMRERVNPANV